MAFLRRIPLLLLATLLAGTTACSDDGPAATPTSTPTVQTPGGSSPDPLEDELLARVRDLRQTVVTARDLLAGATTVDGEEAEEAVAALTAADHLTDRSAGVAPLFPGPLTSRQETIDYGDTLTSTLSAARAAGGPLGVRISQVLADPVAGDLGIWQRDPQGLLDAVDEAARATSVAEAEEAVMELPGEGTRALAFALLASRARTDADVRAYAERAIAHLDVVLRAVDDALADASGGQ